MTRETRANLIFLGIFLALALPGIYKLTVKSYHSGGRDPVMRAPVRGEFAYMDPTPPAGLTRVVPSGTGRYIEQFGTRLEKMQPGLTSIVSHGEDHPVMSDHYNLQVLGLGSDAGQYRVALFGWNDHYAPLPDLYQVVGTRNGKDIKGEIAAYEPQMLPMELRSELQDFGYIVPPSSALWLILSFDGEAPVDSVRVHFHIEKTELLDAIDLAPALKASTRPAIP